MPRNLPPRLRNQANQQGHQGRRRGGPPQGWKDGRPRRCRFFFTSQGCRNGTSCTFSHEDTRSTKPVHTGNPVQSSTAPRTSPAPQGRPAPPEPRPLPRRLFDPNERVNLQQERSLQHKTARGQKALQTYTGPNYGLEWRYALHCLPEYAMQMTPANMDHVDTAINFITHFRTELANQNPQLPPSAPPEQYENVVTYLVYRDPKIGALAPSVTQDQWRYDHKDDPAMTVSTLLTMLLAVHGDLEALKGSLALARHRDRRRPPDEDKTLGQFRKASALLGNCLNDLNILVSSALDQELSTEIEMFSMSLMDVTSALWFSAGGCQEKIIAYHELLEAIKQRLEKHLEPQYGSRDEAKARYEAKHGAGAWASNPAPKKSFAERRREDEEALWETKHLIHAANDLCNETYRIGERAQGLENDLDDMIDLMDSDSDSDSDHPGPRGGGYPSDYGYRSTTDLDYRSTTDADTDRESMTPPARGRGGRRR